MANDNIYYCPRCGRIIIEYEHDNWFLEKCVCRSFMLVKFVDSGISESQFADTPKRPVALCIPGAMKPFNENVYRYIWENFVDVPTNKKLNREAFEALKKQTLERLEYDKLNAERNIEFSPFSRDFYHGPSTTACCPRCRSYSITTTKSGFNFGAAAVGVAAVGPAGALAGGVGANDVVNVCQNCGHKWKPGK